MHEVVIERVRVYEVALPLRVAFTISGGSMSVRRSLIIELVDRSGVCGYGESAPFEFPFYSAETISSVKACLRETLLPRVVGREIRRPEALLELLTDGVRGNRMARAGVDTAWWDLVARMRGESLAGLVSRRLGELGVAGEDLRPSDSVACGVAIGIPAKEDLLVLENEVRSAVRRGYQRVKLKIRPGWDRDPVLAARRVLQSEGAKVPMWVDANGAYDRAGHKENLAALDDLGLLFIEQPFPEEALWDATVQNNESRTPVCLDESLVSEDAARQVVEMDGPLIWNLKVQRLGGLEETCRVYARGVAAGARLWVGTMPETGIGAQAALAVAAHPGCVYPTDLEPSDRWYDPGSDLVNLTMSGSGRMCVPDAAPEFKPSDSMGLLFELD
ncbi:MAG: o-succinylbenzoate synthase [Gemmatimonadales bacterium]